jgi:hypothetical protein
MFLSEFWDVEECLFDGEIRDPLHGLSSVIFHGDEVFRFFDGESADPPPKPNKTVDGNRHERLSPACFSGRFRAHVGASLFALHLSENQSNVNRWRVGNVA